MPATSAQIIKRVFEPTALFGNVYAKLYGSTDAPLPIGNVLMLELDQKEEVETQADMTALGGGIHADMRRVTEINVKMKLADINPVNFARASQGTISGVEGGTVSAEAHTVTLGGLLKTAFKGPGTVVLRKDATVVPAAGNYEVRPSGIYIYPAPALTTLLDGDAVTVDYGYGSYVMIDALTKQAAQLELTFDGLNEAGETDDNGNPRMAVIEIWRASQGVASTIALMAEKGFMGLEVSGSVLKDNTRVGSNVSKFYRVSKN